MAMQRFLQAKRPALLGLWAFGILLGLAHLWRYEANAGRASNLHDWPEKTRLVRHPQDPTLLMFVEPDCPCSRASLAELQRVLDDERSHLATTLVVANVDTTSPPEQSSLWKIAEGRGIALHLDADGAERQAFDAHTSGETQVFAPDGTLMFAGGMTGLRGHVGENPGSMAVAMLARQVSLGAVELPVRTPVYGCSLEDAP